jgi:hypothetical protein
MGESRIIEPMMVFDDDPVHFRQQGGRTAKCHKREQGEFNEEFERQTHFRPSFQ